MEISAIATDIGIEQWQTDWI